MKSVRVGAIPKACLCLMSLGVTLLACESKTAETGAGAATDTTISGSETSATTDLPGTVADVLTTSDPGSTTGSVDTATGDVPWGDTSLSDTAAPDTSLPDATVPDINPATDVDTWTPAPPPPEAGATCDLQNPKCGNLQTCTAWEDGKAYCMCPKGKPYKGGLCEGDTSQVQSMCAYLKEDCKDEGGFCYDVTSSTCTYLDEHKVTHPACAQLGNNKSVAACVSSIADPTSPEKNSQECPLVQYWANPTSYPYDCRCASKLNNRCKRPYNLAAEISFGEGPRMRDLASTVHTYNGIIDGNEWIVPTGWSTFNKKSQTMIFAIDLSTGKRRHVSGTWVDPVNGTTDVGTGAAFVNVMDIKKGADGMYYAMGGTSEIAPPKVWKIDPATGNRTLLFDEETADVATLCPNGSTLPGKKVVQMVPESWAMDADGNHYFGNISMPGPSILKFPASFASCTYLTRISSEAQSSTLKENVGTGYDIIQFDFRALEIVDAKMYAVSDTKLVEIDLATGNRKLLSNAKEVGGLGKGPINAEGLGDRWTRWDPYRKVLWTVGASGGSLAVAVDPATGDRFTWPCWHKGLGVLSTCGNTGTALIPGYLSYGGMVIAPNPPNDLYFAHDLFSIVKYEITTGNAYDFSL